MNHHHHNHPRISANYPQRILWYFHPDVSGQHASKLLRTNVQSSITHGGGLCGVFRQLVQGGTVQWVFKDWFVPWVNIWSEVFEDIVERLQQPHPINIVHQYALEEVIMRKLLVLFLFLKKSPADRPSLANYLNPVARRWFDMYEQGDLNGLIWDYKRDIVLNGSIPPCIRKSEDDEDFKKLQVAWDFLHITLTFIMSAATPPVVWTWRSLQTWHHQSDGGQAHTAQCSNHANDRTVAWGIQ